MRTLKELRPRTKPPEERRDELMNAAQSLFLKQGAASTTIEQITSGADVAKGTFYLHFSSKEDLLTALGERFAQTLLAGIVAALAEKPEDDWKGKLAAWVDAVVSGYLDSMQLHDLVFHESHPPTREGQVDNIIIDHLVELLRGGMAAGAWSIDDPGVTAVYLFSGLHGVVDHSYIKEQQVDRSRLKRRLRQLCFRAVGWHPERVLS